MNDQSPEHIAQRIKKYHPALPYVSGVTVRAYIKSSYGRRIEARRNKLCKRKRGRKKHGSGIKDKRMISKRPKIINAKKRVGDMEGDFIASGKD